jgi:acyl-CoA thioesterase
MPQWTMSEALDFLVELLDLETIEVNVYRGKHPAEERQRIDRREE